MGNGAMGYARPNALLRCTTRTGPAQFDTPPQQAYAFPR